MPSPIAAAFASTLETKGAASIKKYADQAAKLHAHHIKMGETAKGAAQATGKASRSFLDFNDAINKTAVNAYIAKGAVEGAFSHIAGTLTFGASLIKSMADPLANLTKLANPGAVELFDRAFADAMAVMGRVALPVVQAFTRALRTVGNYYAALEPILLGVSNTVAEAIDKVFGDLKKMWDEMGPAAELLGSALSFAIKGVANLARAFIHIAAILAKVYNAVARFLGFKGDSFNKGASGFGAAVRQVTISRSAEDISKANQSKALEQALALAQGPKKADVPDLLTGIGTKFDDLIRIMKTLPADLAKAIWDAISNKIGSGEAGKNAAGVAQGAAGAIGGNAIGKLAGLLASAMTR